MDEVTNLADYLFKYGMESVIVTIPQHKTLLACTLRDVALGMRGKVDWDLHEQHRMVLKYSKHIKRRGQMAQRGKLELFECVPIGYAENFLEIARLLEARLQYLERK